MTKIILIAGPKRGGKDYCGEQISLELNRRGYSTSIMRFADPMKFIIAETFGITMDELEDYKNDTDTFGIEIKAYPNNQPQATIEYTDFREILQRFGTEAMKPVFGENVWAKIVYDKIDASENEEIDFILVPDFRFMIEYDERATTLKVTNTILESNSEDTHASENDLANFTFNYEIDNTEQKDISDEIKTYVDKLLIERKYNETN